MDDSQWLVVWSIKPMCFKKKTCYDICDGRKQTGTRGRHFTFTKGHRQDLNPCYQVKHLSPSATKGIQVLLLSAFLLILLLLHLRDSSSEGHQKINELITDRGNVSDTAPSCLPPPIMIIIFSYLRSGCLSQQDIPNESGGHTCLSPFIFLITLLSFIPVIIWKSHYSKSGYHEGFWDPAQYEVCLGNVRSAVFMQE